MTGHGKNHPKEILHLDSWVVGIPEMILGFSIYGNRYPAQNFGWHTNDGHGYTGVYPNDIPSELAYFKNRYCPIAAEFTIHETLASYAFSLSYFTSPSVNVNTADTEIKLEDCGITIYPNPSQNFVNIKGLSGSYTIQILNGNGQVYQTLSVSGNDKIIDISAFPNGMFHIKNHQQ